MRIDRDELHETRQRFFDGTETYDDRLLIVNALDALLTFPTREMVVAIDKMANRGSVLILTAAGIDVILETVSEVMLTETEKPIRPSTNWEPLDEDTIAEARFEMRLQEGDH